MPPDGWSPDWEDVDFDYDKARAAADQCRLAAGALTTLLDGLVTAHATLRREGSWAGAYRDDFDDEMPEVVAEARDARRSLRRLATAIDAAMTSARNEQLHREMEREHGVPLA